MDMLQKARDLFDGADGDGSRQDALCSIAAALIAIAERLDKQVLIQEESAGVFLDDGPDWPDEPSGNLAHVEVRPVSLRTAGPDWDAPKYTTPGHPDRLFKGEA